MFATVQCAKSGASRSVRMTAYALAFAGPSAHETAGETLSPSHVYLGSMAVPGFHGAVTVITLPFPSAPGLDVVVTMAIDSPWFAPGAFMVRPSFVEHDAVTTARHTDNNENPMRRMPFRLGAPPRAGPALVSLFRMPMSPLSATGEPLCLLTVHAHPDDEASKGASTVARYFAEGVRTVLVCCTGGEEGDLQNPSLREPGQPFHGLTPEQEKALLAEVRPKELERSVGIIGFSALHMLGYRDSGMAGTPPNDHPDCFHQADIDEATGRLVRIIRTERPQVILTYNDDQRGYPHPDHLRVHDISVLAFERAGDPMWYPDAGEPWQPSKMYYTLWSKERVLAVHEALLAKDGKSPFEEAWLNRPSQDHRITTRLHLPGYLSARSGSLRAHATQVDPSSAWWFGLTDEELATVYPWEDWILAMSTMSIDTEHVMEDDLFAGVRADSSVPAG